MAADGTPRLSVADLFCGAGGLSEGMRQIGLDVVFGLDKDRDSCETYQRNHPAATVECAKITELTPQDIARRVGGHVDVIVGGPSCQGFSTAGRRNGWVRDDDDRNDLWSHMLAVVGHLKPRAFLMENVPGLFAWKEGQFGWRIIQAFRDLGYGVRHDILLAADYGAPQLRRRLFIVGLRGAPDEAVAFPAPTHLGGWRRDTLGQWEQERVRRGLLKQVSCWDALADLPALGDTAGMAAMAYSDRALTPTARHLRAGAGDLLHDHEAVVLGEDARALVRHVPQGGTWRDIPAHLLPERFAGMRRTDSTNLYGRLDPARPSYTINTQFMNVTTGCYTHPFEDRALSVREGARLQTFPDSYRFVGTLTSKARQVGNAVPPLMGSVLGASIAQHLEHAGDRSTTHAPVISPAAQRPAHRPTPATSARMSRQKKTGTRPEVTLRRLLHAQGLRYLVDARPLPDLRRSADLLFRGSRVAVFVDGCFWPGCPAHARATKSNTVWWRDKIERNRARDVETTAALQAAGWTVLRIWEHEAPQDAALRVRQAVLGCAPQQVAS